MNGARLYGRYVAASLRAQMQYPASFIATSIGAFAATVIDFIGIWALFARFRQIEAWRFEEVALFYGVVSVSFAIADAITRGFDVFGERFVKTGDFDRLLVRPRSTVLQLLGYELRATRIGRLAQGMLAWGVAVDLFAIDFTWEGWALLSFADTGDGLTASATLNDGGNSEDNAENRTGDGEGHASRREIAEGHDRKDHVSDGQDHSKQDQLSAGAHGSPAPHPALSVVFEPGDSEMSKPGDVRKSL